jgi:predicted nuclease with TOPRIM domain
MNVMTEKHFLVKRFYNGLVTEARIVFQAVRKDLDGWLKSAMTPISNQLKEHQTLLERRVENLKKLSGDLSSLQERLHQLETQKMALGKQVEDLLRIKYKVLGTAEKQKAVRAKAA